MGVTLIEQARIRAQVLVPEEKLASAFERFAAGDALDYDFFRYTLKREE